jgi:molecular chaperone DnaJ
MSKDYYNLLGVSKNASVEEIKQAFRKKAHQYHPDKIGGNAEKFKEINEAYQVLGNAERKKQYDQFGTTFENLGGQQAYEAGFDWSDLFRQGASGFRTSGFNFDFTDLSDIFEDFFGATSRSNYGSRGAKHSQKGQDLEISLMINFEEAIFGTEKVLDISKQVICDKCSGNGAEPDTKIITCKTCGGSGQIVKTQQTFFGAFRTAAVCQSCHGEGKMAEKKCTNCHGSGVVQGKERIRVKIPAGINNNETIRLSQKGEAGNLGGKSGDLYINVRVLPHADFQRTGDNIYTKKDISFSQAVLGDKVRIKTLDGEVKVKIPAGTPAGKQFILKGKGSYKLHGRGRGDLIVEVKVNVPANLTREQKRLVEELGKEGL